MTITQAELNQFTGTETWTRWNPILFPRFTLTEGALYVANNADAYWLMDLIASHQPKLLKHQRMREMQVWTLKVKDGKAVATCQDGDYNTVTEQKIEYTDFPMEEIVLWFMPLDETRFTILLPSEY